MATFLVTGGSGFIGSHLVEKLLTGDNKVVVVDDLRSGYIKNLKGCISQEVFKDVESLRFESPKGIYNLNNNVIFYKSSITDKAEIEKIFKNHSFDFVFHLAAIVSVPYSVSHEKETVEINYEGTMFLAETADKFSCRGLVHAGSAAEYGDNAPIPAREEYITDLIKQSSPYGYTKYKAGKFVAEKKGKLCGVNLRCFNIYGPRQDPKSQYSGVISKFMDCAVRNEPLPICGDGEQTRDFIFVGDVVQAYVFAAGVDKNSTIGSYQGERIFNVATGRKTTVNQLADTIIKVSQKSILPKHIQERPGDIRHSCADVKRIKEGLGWQAQVALEQGLKITYDWYKS